MLVNHSTFTTSSGMDLKNESSKDTLFDDNGLQNISNDFMPAVYNSRNKNYGLIKTQIQD